MSSANDASILWRSAYEANDQAQWLELAQWLEEQGQSSAASALRTAVAALEPSDELSPHALLPVAAEAGQAAIVQAVLERGVPDYHGALKAAARGGHKDVVAVLLEHDEKSRAAGCCLWHNHLGPLDAWSYDFHLAYSPPENEPMVDREDLYVAAEAGHRDVVELLLNYAEDNGPSHALRGAACGGHWELACWLLTRGAALEEGLAGAVYSGPKEMVEFFLARGAKVDQPTAGMAVAYRDTEIVDLLLQHGASPNWGLSDAIFRRRTEIVEFLLARGAVPNEQNLNCAAKHYPEILDRLRRLG